MGAGQEEQAEGTARRRRKKRRCTQRRRSSFVPRKHRWERILPILDRPNAGPIRGRRCRAAEKPAIALARRHVSHNGISIAAMMAGIAGGGCVRDYKVRQRRFDRTSPDWLAAAGRSFSCQTPGEPARTAWSDRSRAELRPSASSSTSSGIASPMRGPDRGGGRHAVGRR